MPPALTPVKGRIEPRRGGLRDASASKTRLPGVSEAGFEIGQERISEDRQQPPGTRRKAAYPVTR